MAERRQSYIYGNTVRKIEPVRREIEREPIEKTPSRQRERKISHQTKKNRQQAEVMNLSYVLFLAMVSILIVAACVMYLNLQSTISTRSSNITSLQRELSDLQMENDAALDSVEDSVNLESIKLRAEALGMVYVQNSQIIEYSSPTVDYVKQYEVIPESGVLAQSEVVTE